VNSQDTLDDTLPAHGIGYERMDDEKIDFPSQPVPTFSAVYGEPPEEPEPAQLPLGARVLGPRFFALQDGTTAAQFAPGELPPGAAPAWVPGHLARQGSASSQRSGTSIASSMHSDESGLTMKSKRWVIE
jgi:hypothetical protein